MELDEALLRVREDNVQEVEDFLAIMDPTKSEYHVSPGKSDVSSVIDGYMADFATDVHQICKALDCEPDYAINLVLTCRNGSKLTKLEAAKKVLANAIIAAAVMEATNLKISMDSYSCNHFWVDDSRTADGEQFLFMVDGENIYIGTGDGYHRNQSDEFVTLANPNFGVLLLVKYRKIRDRNPAQ